ncbi:RNase H domain-containing protein [Trichonephila clavipes]|nr:RNase H domain-containing protein [Trichonephila clavipes]
MKIYKKSTVGQRINLNLGGVIIEEVHKIKYLGIIVDNKMQWKELISYVSSKRYKTISYEAVFVIPGIPPIGLVILNNLDVRENYLCTSLGTLNGTIPVPLLPHPSCRKPITLVTYTNEVFQEYKTVYFTDGSKLNGRVGLACVIYEEGVENVTFQHRLRDECSVFKAELLCIYLIILLIQDSLLYSLYYLDCDIPFSYVRGHSGSLGNDRADQLAKEATCQDMNLFMPVPLSHWKHVAWERTVSSWNTEFLASPKALWTKRFLPTIYQRLKSEVDRAGLGLAFVR